MRAQLKFGIKYISKLWKYDVLNRMCQNGQLLKIAACINLYKMFKTAFFSVFIVHVTFKYDVLLCHGDKNRNKIHFCMEQWVDFFGSLLLCQNVTMCQNGCANVPKW